ncbi:telomere repeat-binding protein 4 [Coffea arabica]|uniref:Telomere repeat-binding protein 4 n=1 Tax=Coffea arabica TaxID=13443 RepID=A0A6P6W8R3_COFAR|nr:telomere repeat-binding protein 2-like [Coffea arabica]XP_027110976.1 telomere repeat-binding protein 2-like [Coffea arabica]
MVLKKRLDYGFHGYQIPVIPRAPRSVRRRGPHKKSVEDHQICAFELLAAVAGKLLQESESSASSNASEAKVQPCHMDGIKKERSEETKTFRTECLDQGSCVESAFIPERVAGEQNFKSSVEDHPNLENDSIITSSDFSKKVDCDLKLGICNNKTADEDNQFKVAGGSHPSQNICNGKTETAAKRLVGDETKWSQELTVANSPNVKHQVGKCMNSKTVINSDGSVQLSLYRDPVSSASFPKHRNNVNLGIRDDDDNSFGCNKLSTKFRAFRPQARNGYRRIRKMLQSKYWRVAPKLRDYEVSNTNEGMRSFYRNRKFIHTRDRCQHEAPSKRRKLSGRRFVVAYDQEASSESISNSPEKGEYRRSDGVLDKANGSSTSVKVHKKSKDSSVKFSIKSFKVPELYIEVPETATVGSLKTTVLETVTAILGGGVRVGVVLQGKKVRDDNRTLQQAGISHGGNLDSLGFILEPNFTQVIEPSKDSPQRLQHDTDEKFVRPPASPLQNSGPSNAAIDPLPATKMEKQNVSNHEIILSPKTPVIDSKAVVDGAGTESKALVPVAPVGAEALAMVPVSQKMKRSEVSQRRTRRPFSVGEVEALVEAVEILGTGRWRDVKMRAFDNADHRTYVDLKDKWKTLVHTASISPQQRRGEPVPQELLDRVLSAHSYWSQHQSKQHGKHQIDPLQIMDAQAEKYEA